MSLWLTKYHAVKPCGEWRCSSMHS